MAKMKTHKGLKKRFHITARGKVRHKRTYTGHLMSGKTGDRCRAMRQPAILEGSISKRIKVALGAG
jgi:large subunit ribosomal protein L35